MLNTNNTLKKISAIKKVFFKKNMNINKLNFLEKSTYKCKKNNKNKNNKNNKTSIMISSI